MAPNKAKKSKTGEGVKRFTVYFPFGQIGARHELWRGYVNVDQTGSARNLLARAEEYCCTLFFGLNFKVQKYDSRFKRTKDELMGCYLLIADDLITPELMALKKGLASCLAT